jgi:5-methylcytosine-specific restriction endonuclease McrA
VKDKTRLRWRGSLEAQDEADAAWEKAKASRRPPEPKTSSRAAKRKRKRRRQQEIPRRPDGSIDYRAYIKSARWRKKTHKARKYYRGVCQVCGTRRNLSVHHRHYRTLGRERMEDLELLCHACHANKHEGDVAGVVDPMTAQYLALDL